MEIKIVTWNMDHWKRTREAREMAWNYLDQTIAPDIALVQEAVPPTDRIDSETVLWLEISRTRKWGSGVLTKSFPLQEAQFQNSHPGSLVVADVELPHGVALTVASLYGLLDDNGYATTTLHRMLSDLTSLLHGKRRKRKIVIGGDFNASTQWDEHYPQDPSHRIVFDRLKDFGLEDCLARFHPTHVQTNRHPKSNVPWQNDYIYASKEVADSLLSCYVIDDPEVYDLSDHNPVVAVFDI